MNLNQMIDYWHIIKKEKNVEVILLDILLIDQNAHLFSAISH